MNVNFITPPHTASSIVRCLCFAEKISDHQNMRLFLDLSSESPLEDKTPVSILTGGGAGFNADEPMALVHSPDIMIQAPKSVPSTKTYRLKAKYNRRSYFLHFYIYDVSPDCFQLTTPPTLSG
jgi:hypothetical protein